MSNRQPNFIIILADDLGFADIRRYSETLDKNQTMGADPWLTDGGKIDTPVLDRLMDEGAQFTHYYCASPRCSPSRASLLTGRYPQGANVGWLVTYDLTEEMYGPAYKSYLDPAIPTFATELARAGYASMISGKWHLCGHEPEHRATSHPLDLGFREFYGILDGCTNYYKPHSLMYNRQPVEDNTYFTDQVTGHAVSFLEQYKHQPFCLYVSYTAPHWPLQAPEDLIQKYVTRYGGLAALAQRHGSRALAVYAAQVECMDQGIGSILDKLESIGQADNTMIFFLSDNGPSDEAAGYGRSGAEVSNGNLRRYKKDSYEGGIASPLIVRWPGRIRPGTVLHETCITMDILPTLCEAAGVAPPENLDGKSLLPILAGKARVPHEILFWEHEDNWAVLHEGWKLVIPDWSDRPELYHLAEDRQENHDLAHKYPDRVNHMMKRLDTWKNQVGARAFDPRAYHRALDDWIKKTGRARPFHGRWKQYNMI